MTKNEILQELTKNKSYIEEHFEVERIGLFGSYAKDKQTQESDIDIYVEFRHKTFDNLAGLWNYLEELYHKKVDLFHKHKNNNPIIISNIQKDVIYG
ncbi:MAG: nucleotidyltransferase domain-containing protein [Sulfurimonas sp.]|nr:nucleotidyltransferase domain-containing protein [Sulfurimonas sp.]MDD3061057.1 nucleotidyltransferase domain-containing protein [Sulfurimonas sp.]MDD5203438.1 nucleotidyltransferase domain-containing protein [Sulfurimonas sp.]